MQTLTEEYYGHIVEVEFTTTPEGEELESVPDYVKEVIFNNLTDDSDSGEFTEKKPGYNVPAHGKFNR